MPAPRSDPEDDPPKLYGYPQNYCWTYRACTRKKITNLADFFRTEGPRYLRLHNCKTYVFLRRLQFYMGRHVGMSVTEMMASA
jgi:hypothetical protein